MKTYRVILSDEALQGVEQYLDYIIEQTGLPNIAARWWEKAVEQIYSLDHMPHRCPLAPENETSRYELRMLIVDSCLFIYHVVEDEEKVNIVKFRHGRQQVTESD